MGSIGNFFKFIKIWYWWNYKLKKNEFSKFLDLDLTKMNEKNANKELIARRELAHLLDCGHSLSQIFKNNITLINKTNI